MGGKENIKVVCRVRPLNDKEKKKGEHANVKVLNEQQVQVEGREKKYNFDAVCGPDSTQEEVYEVGAKKVVDDILKGFNGTIFAYGQTSSGKTYTMEGEKGEDRGIIPRIIEDLWEHSKESKQIDLNIKAAYFEIYNEKIRDLLDKGKVNLPIHEDKFKSPYVKYYNNDPKIRSSNIP
ncbi:kinesin heavy chain-like [Convolutriloba macropyga]|uniref:kinesin heavy chain-like n=1 Tax=Convolutriloba macropyga TaxID=536237 RepID=UPI003F524515